MPSDRFAPTYSPRATAKRTISACALAGWADGTDDIPNGIYGFTEIDNGNALVGSAGGTGTAGALLVGADGAQARQPRQRRR